VKGFPWSTVAEISVEQLHKEILVKLLAAPDKTLEYLMSAQCAYESYGSSSTTLQ